MTLRSLLVYYKKEEKEGAITSSHYDRFWFSIYRKKKTRLLSDDIMVAFGSVYIGRKKRGR